MRVESMLSRERLWEHAKWLYRDGWRAADKQLLMERLHYDDEDSEIIHEFLKQIEKQVADDEYREILNYW